MKIILDENLPKALKLPTHRLKLLQDLRKIIKNVDAKRRAAGYRQGRKGHKEIRVSESFCISSILETIAVVRQLRTLANLTERLVTAIRSGLCPNQHGSRYITDKILVEVESISLGMYVQVSLE